MILVANEDAVVACELLAEALREAYYRVVVFAVK